MVYAKLVAIVSLIVLVTGAAQRKTDVQYSLIFILEFYLTPLSLPVLALFCNDNDRVFFIYK